MKGVIVLHFSSNRWTMLDKCFQAKIPNAAKYFCLYLLFNGGNHSFYLGEIASILNCSERSAGAYVGMLIKEGFVRRTLVSHDRSLYELVSFK